MGVVVFIKSVRGTNLNVYKYIALLILIGRYANTEKKLFGHNKTVKSSDEICREEIAVERFCLKMVMFKCKKHTHKKPPNSHKFKQFKNNPKTLSLVCADYPGAYVYHISRTSDENYR